MYMQVKESNKTNFMDTSNVIVKKESNSSTNVSNLILPRKNLLN